MDAGDPATNSHLSCSVHAGTHLDAPSHVIRGGKTVEELPLEVLMGPAYVAHLPDVEEVSPAALQSAGLPLSVERLLLRTRNSELWAQTEFNPDYVALTPEAAEWIVARGVRLIGVDYLSVQRFRDSEPATHITLLEAGVVIVEGLNLSAVPAGQYRLTCLPLRLSGTEGAPARAVLTEINP